MSSLSDWPKHAVRDLITHHASGPSPTCEERNIADNEEWGLLKTTAVTWNGWDATAHKVPPPEYWANRSIEVRAGDVLVTKAGPRDRCGVSVYVTETPPHLLISGKMILLRPDPKKTNAPFLASALASARIQRFLDARTTGLADAQLNFTNQLLLGLELELPSLSEQLQIADIRTTLDEAIEQTEALIAKTQQIKAGLMHDLFTRGVTPDGRLRPPQEEAPQLYKQSPLGWIPNEWDLKSCSDICLSVIDCKNRTPPLTEDGHPVIRTPNVRDGEFVRADLVHTDAVSYIEWTARGRPIGGDVVITREAPVGEVCMIPDDLEAPCLGQRTMLYRPDPNQVLGSFLVQVLQSTRVQKHLDVISGGSTVGHVRVGDIRSLRVPWAPMPEQEAIAPKFDCVRNQLTNLRTEALKLQQIKAGLMHDLLTGHVPVAQMAVADV